MAEPFFSVQMRAPVIEILIRNIGNPIPSSTDGYVPPVQAPNRPSFVCATYVNATQGSLNTSDNLAPDMSASDNYVKNSPG